MTKEGQNVICASANISSNIYSQILKSPAFADVEEHLRLLKGWVEKSILRQPRMAFNRRHLVNRLGLILPLPVQHEDKLKLNEWTMSIMSIISG